VLRSITRNVHEAAQQPLNDKMCIHLVDQQITDNIRNSTKQMYNTIQYKSQFVTRHTSQGESEARG